MLSSTQSRLSAAKAGFSGKRLLILFVLLFTVFFSYTIVAQEFGKLRSGHEITIPEKIHKLVLDPLPGGTYSVGTGGYFPTIDSAFNKLSIDGIAGEVILELTDALYTAPSLSSFILNGPIPGAGTSSRVTIQPADNVAVTIEGDGEAVLLFYDVSYLTLDGISLQGNTRLQVHALYNQLTPNWNDAIDFFGNSDYVQVQNLTTSSDDVTRYSAAIYFGTLGQDAPDSGLVSGVFVPIANSGIYLLGDGSLNPTGFVLSNNYIGSPTDSLIVWGIQNQMADGTIIENNKVENIRYGSPVNSIYYVHGINAYWSKNVIVRNNIVHNIVATVNNSRVQGIEISGGAGQSGVNNWVYNNMVYDIRSYASQNVGLSGIRAWDQDNLRIEYNSVALSEVGDVAPGTGSAALWFESSNNSPSAYNNILVNTRNDSPYVSAAIRFDASSGVSDFNDLYVGLFDNSYIGQSGGTLYKSIADWQATGKDLNSVTEMPNFVDPYLHIDETIATYLESRATPIAGIDTDYDGDTRNVTTPDIGADEFDGIVVGVEKETALPTEFALEQNYPNPFNPSTKIKYSVPKSTNVTIKVFDILGKEIETLINEEKPVGTYELTWYAESLPSGVYFYQLKAGEFVSTKKMILLK